jgi:hypothetical protein
VFSFHWDQVKPEFLEIMPSNVKFVFGPHPGTFFFENILSRLLVKCEEFARIK